MSSCNCTTDLKIVLATSRIRPNIAFRISDSDCCLNAERIINLLRLGVSSVRISCGEHDWSKIIELTCKFVKQFALEDEEIDSVITSDGKVATITLKTRNQP